MTYKMLKRIEREYYNYGTETNGTVTGTLTNTDGVIGVCSTSNYLSTPYAINFHDAQNWEITFRLKHSATTSSQGMFATKVRYSGINFYHNSANILALELSSAGSSFDIGTLKGTTSLPANTFYYARAEFTGSAYNLYYSTDGVNWNLEATLSSTTKIAANAVFLLGTDDQIVSHVPDFYIDLTKCDIKLNGVNVWHGTKGVLQEVVTKPSIVLDGYDYYIDRDVYKAYKGGGNTMRCLKTPDYYKELEYLESTGTQYINSGVYDIDKVDCTWQLNSWCNYFGVYGNYVDENTNSVRLIGQASDNNAIYVTNNFKTGASFGISLTYYEKHQTVATNTDITIDGVTTSYGTTTAGTANTTNILIFSQVSADTFSGKIYHIAMYKDNVLVRDFVPVERTSDNELGLFDKVENKFYRNVGSGTFNKGGYTTSNNYDYSSN